MNRKLDELVTVGWSPDLKNFNIRLIDPEACTEKEVQNHIYAAVHNYLRKLRHQKGKNHGYTQLPQ